MIELQFNNFSIFILIRCLSYSFRSYIKNINSQYFLSPMILLILMFLGESFSLFFYLYQYKHIKKEKKLYFESKTKKNNYCHKIYFLFIICFCSFADLIGSFNYQYIYSNSMKSISSKFKSFEFIVLCLSVCINECYTLNIQIYNHQILGLYLVISSLIISFIININKNQNFQSFILIIIIIIESKFILAMLYIIEKKLNYEYFININLLLFIEGIFGICILLIYRIFYVFIFKFDNSFFIQIKNNKNNLELFLIYFLYSILSFIYNFCRLRITELTRPSYNIIGNLLCFFFDVIIESILMKKFLKMDIITFIISLFGFLVYCEIIILKFCKLDENTIFKTKMRASKDFLSNQMGLSIQNCNSSQLFEF